MFPPYSLLIFRKTEVKELERRPPAPVVYQPCSVQTTNTLCILNSTVIWPLLKSCSVLIVLDSVSLGLTSKIPTPHEITFLTLFDISDLISHQSHCCNIFVGSVSYRVTKHISKTIWDCLSTRCSVRWVCDDSVMHFVRLHTISSFSVTL